MDETSKVSKGLKYGGRLVFAWDIISSGQSVADVYKTGDSEATRKEIIKQTGKIEGGLLVEFWELKLELQLVLL
ncbi:hypothetical protein [Acinetobacter junii]|nr:hypothetical protein [Acinetobacter junii]